MEKTIGQIQEEAEAVKVEINKILDNFLTENPVVSLSGDFGTEKDWMNYPNGEKVYLNIKTFVTLNINIDEK